MIDNQNSQSINHSPDVRLHEESEDEPEVDERVPGAEVLFDSYDDMDEDKEIPFEIPERPMIKLS